MEPITQCTLWSSPAWRLSNKFPSLFRYPKNATCPPDSTQTLSFLPPRFSSRQPRSASNFASRHKTHSEKTVEIVLLLSIKQRDRCLALLHFCFLRCLNMGFSYLRNTMVIL
ncbi:hypothetical protein SLE2022_090320 [Rubroshorea leprosula]